MTQGGIDPTLVVSATVAAFVILGSGITIITFWMRFSDRVTMADGKAEAARVEAANALHVAAEATEEAKTLHDRITTLAAENGLYRERAVKMFVEAGRLEDVEKRLVSNMDKTERRLTDAISGLTLRLDKVLQQRDS